jgi:Tfp pilus assembly protein PilX
MQAEITAAEQSLAETNERMSINCYDLELALELAEAFRRSMPRPMSRPSAASTRRSAGSSRSRPSGMATTRGQSSMSLA